MKVVIGVQHVARELVLDIEMSSEEFINAVKNASASESVLELTDAQGQQYIVPGKSIAYAQVTSNEPRRVGFTF